MYRSHLEKGSVIGLCYVTLGFFLAKTDLTYPTSEKEILNTTSCFCFVRLLQRLVRQLWIGFDYFILFDKYYFLNEINQYKQTTP